MRRSSPPPSADRRPTGGRAFPAVVATAAAIPTTLALALAALLATPPGPIAAQAPRTVRSLDAQPAGAYGHGFARIAADGARVFALEGDRIAAFDLADPTAPRPLGHTDPLADPTLIAAGTGLVAVVVHPTGDAGPPSLALFDSRAVPPTAAGTVPLGACDAMDVAVAGTWIAVACGAAGVRIVDASAPDRPVIATTLLDSGLARAVAMDGRRLLVGGAAGEAARDGGYAALYDVADPARPVLSSDTRWPAPVVAVGLGKECALVGSRDMHFITRLAVVDLDTDIAGGSTSPWAVRAERTFDGIAGGPRIASDGAHAFATLPVWIRGESKVLDVDLTGPDAPWAQDLHFPWHTVDVAPLPGGLAVDDGYRGLVHYGRDADAKLAERAIVPTISSPYGAATDGTHLFVADDDDELWSLDVDDPAAARVIGRSALGPPLGGWMFPTYGGGLALGAGRAVAVRGPAFSSIGDVGLVDLADPLRPRPLGRWVAESDPGISRAPKDTYSFATTSRYDPIDLGDLVLVPSHDAGVTVLDVRDPAAPTFASVLARQGGCGSWSGRTWVMGNCDVRGVAAADRTVYVAGSESGVLMYTLQDDGTATAAGTIDVPGEAYDVAVVGDALLVAVAFAGERGGVRVIDRRTLQAVRSVEGFAALRLRIAGDTAFVVGVDQGADVVGSRDAVWAIDIADPFAPVVRARIPLPASADAHLRPAHVARIGDVLAVVAAVEDGDGPTILLYRLTDGEPLPAVAPGATLTAWPTRAPSASREPEEPTAVGEPGATATLLSPTVAPPEVPMRRAFLPMAIVQR